MSDGEPISGVDSMTAVGMTKPKKEFSEEPSIVKPAKSLIEAKESRSDEDRFDNLFAAENIELLVQQRENQNAQLLALVLMSNTYRNFNIRNETCVEWLATSNVDIISQTLGLDETTAEFIKTKRGIFLETHNKYKELSKRYYEVEDLFEGSYGDTKEAFKEQLQAIQAQELQTEALMATLFRELMLPVRRAVLTSKVLPEQYKLQVVEGVKGYGSVLADEDSLLKEYYSSASEAVRKQIADTAMFNMGHDINSFDIVPIVDLQKYGVDTEAVFIATLGNRQTTADFVEQRVAPAFFPNRDSSLVRQTWEILKRVTGLESQKGTSFASDGYNHHTNLMNTEFFSDFMENTRELTPIVDMLSEFGFLYIPTSVLEGGLNNDYIARLKELGGNLDELKRELHAIESIVPDYKYRFSVGTRYTETKDAGEIYIEDNPFSIALEQRIFPHGLKTEEKFNQAVELFASLQEAVPERWRSGFVATYVDMMSMTASYKDHPGNITSRAVAEAGRYVFDTSLIPGDVELFTTKFFEASLDPRNEGIESVFTFCDKYANNIRTWVGGTKRVDADSTWYMLSLHASDVYRYPIVAGKEVEAVEKAKRDMTYAIGAVSRITNPVIRDKAISNLIYGLTDEEIGDLKTAQLFVEMMGDENLKKDAEIEIQLEIERANKGESTTWKKMEKVRRISVTNTQFIKDLFGYSSADGLQVAQAHYREQTSMSPDYFATYSDERKLQLGQEIERIRDNFCVTLNITWINVLKTLTSGRVISIWENPEVMEYRNETGKYDYETRRDEIERLIGNRAKGGMNDPHPLYGAGSSPNNRDEFYGGTGGGYGETFLVLKSDRIRDRTSFCYDDSFDGYHDWMLDWNGGITAKAIHNLNGSHSRHGYVEAQILGGVTLDDIESINIPSDALSGENKFGWSVGTNVLTRIEELRQKYPNIKINIVEVPKKQNES